MAIMPTIRQMQYLVALEDAGHFGRAADRVNVTQPTLSQQVRDMELRLGAVLVERARPVRLTPLGRDVAARARRVLREVAEIRAVAQRGQEGMSGTVRFGVSPTLGPYLMPHAVVRLHRDYPDLRLYIREGIPADHFAALQNGQLDMMLTPTPPVGRDLHTEPLFREKMHLVGAPDNPLFAREALTYEDFAGQPMLCLEHRHPSYRQAAEICDRLGAEILRDYEGTSLDSLRQMAGSGLGLGDTARTLSEIGNRRGGYGQALRHSGLERKPVNRRSLVRRRRLYRNLCGNRPDHRRRSTRDIAIRL